MTAISYASNDLIEVDPAEYFDFAPEISASGRKNSLGDTISENDDQVNDILTPKRYKHEDSPRKRDHFDDHKRVESKSDHSSSMTDSSNPAGPMFWAVHGPTFMGS